MTYYRIAYVYVRKVFTGVLSETDYGYSFKYDEEYLSSPHATAVSLTLPLRKEEYKSHFLFPFFDGLIPEGWLLNIVTQKRGRKPKIAEVAKEYKNDRVTPQTIRSYMKKFGLEDKFDYRPYKK